MVGIQTVRKIENRSKSREEFFSIKYCDRLPYMGFRYLYEALDQFIYQSFCAFRHRAIPWMCDELV